MGVENTWNYTAADVADLVDSAEQAQGDVLELDIGTLDQLAGSLADELTLQQNDYFKGSVWFHHHPQHPPVALYRVECTTAQGRSSKCDRQNGVAPSPIQYTSPVLLCMLLFLPIAS